MSSIVTQTLGTALMSRAGRFFRYTDGHYDLADRMHQATFFHSPEEIARAMRYAEQDGYGPMTVVEVTSQARALPFSYEDVVRKTALAKLDSEEKRILGL